MKNNIINNKTKNEAIEKHNELNPLLWENNKLKKEVKDKILDIVEYFKDDLKENEVVLDVIDIVILGSNCSFNYTKDSDLDIHIVASSKDDCNKKHLDKLYSAYRSIFNKNMNISFYDIPVEIYVEMDECKAKSNGIYSVLNDKWIKEPVEKDIPDIDQEEFEKQFAVYEDKYFDLLDALGE